jgi:flagellar hook-associated protein 1 FlgK
MSMFNILGTGLSGLQAAQQALDVIGQNIANANTDGYSRQRVDLKTSQINPSPSLYTGSTTLLSGVSTGAVERMKTAYLQTAASTALGKQSALQSQATPLSKVEALTHEPSDTGLQATLDKFYGDWADLANNPTSGAAGGIVLTDGSAVASQLNTLSRGVATEWANQRDNLSAVVQQANSAAQQVSTLNSQIVQGQATGLNVNALLDQRDITVNTLASLVGGTTATSDNGQVSVLVGGISLVTGGSAIQLTLGGGSDLSGVAADPPTLSIGKVMVSPSSGSAAGLLSALRTDLPSISTQLDSVATSLRDAVNGLQTGGFTLAGASGSAFFVGTGAADLAVGLSSADELAVSAVAGAQDGSNAQRIADLSDDATAAAALGGAPGPSALWRGITSTLGAQVQGLNTALATQTSIVGTAQNAVISDSGVSIDEESVNMLLFQRSYQASAKVITAADAMLQTLISMGT